MEDKHVFSKSYTDRREAVLNALRREEAIETGKHAHGITYLPVKILIAVIILSAFTVSIYAAVHWIDFRMERDGETVHVHASLNETGENNGADEKPVRSWNAEEGEISSIAC